MTDLQGKRVDDGDYDGFYESGPGTYRRKTISGHGAEGAVCWHVTCPGDCGNYMLLGPKPPAAGHFVEENEDGTITVRANPPADPQNSNSVLCPKCGWHGYIDHGLWRTV